MIVSMPEEAQDKQQVNIKGVDIKKAEIQDFEVPSFVNYAYVWHYGGDLYIDLGLLTVEQMAALCRDKERKSRSPCGTASS